MVDVPSPEALRTRDSHRVVNFHAALLSDHVSQGVLGPTSHVMCLGIVVHNTRSPPLIVATAHNSCLPFDTNSVDFVFTGRTLDTANRRAHLVAEAPQILEL
jgi:hypothetical protein